MKGKCALVTGAARGIGKEIALALARQGVSIAIHYHKSKKEAEAVVDEILGQGCGAVSIGLDLARVGKFRGLVEKASDALGGLDILINNASQFSKTPLDAATEKEWDAMLGVNLKAAFFLAQAAAPYLKVRSPGKIINIADVYAFSPSKDFIPYGVSKAGLVALTKGLAKALAPDIQVNCVCPGVIEKSDRPHESIERVIDKTPLKRAGTPSDIVDAVLYLLMSDYVTGEEICVDGGRHLI